MTTRTLSSLLVLVALAFVPGCVNGVIPSTDNDPTVQAVATKANSVASSVGGQDGYGGALMMGYADHMPEQMGFTSRGDLAGHGDMMTISLRNEADQVGTFHLSYFASHMGFVDEMMDVEVPAGDETTLEIPCSEIVGMGPLHEPGAAGCHLDDGEAVDNMMAVPGFLGQDFTCGGTYACVLTQDVDDLDGDGDTEELVVVSNAMDLHMMNGGPMGHAHGGGPGMMGSHMGM